MSLIRVFRRGEIFAICKAALAQAPAGMDTRELAARAVGMDEGDAVRRWREAEGCKGLVRA